MQILGVAIILCLLSTALSGASFTDAFAVVFIDRASEAKFGPYPLDRAILAKAIRQAGNLGAKGVVLKFFLDQPTSERSDPLLEQAMTNTPVLLQARIDDLQLNPNALPNDFTFPLVKAHTQVSGRSGWIPLPRFSQKATGVGFVDFASTEVPMLENYRSQTVKSLTVCCIELATGTQAIIEPGRRIKFGAQELRVDPNNCIRAKLPAIDDLDYIPFHQFVAGEIPLGRIKGKVVILGYDGAQMHSLPTAIGPIRAHRFFVYTLRSVYDQLGL